MKTILTFLLLFPMLLLSQEDDIVKHEPYSIKITEDHIIQVPDSLTGKVIIKYVGYMERNPIDYEKDFRKIKAVTMLEGDRDFVGQYKDGVIFLNWRLNYFPNVKRAAVLHYLAVNNKMPVIKGNTGPLVSSNSFDINNYNETMFSRQFRNDSPYRYVVKVLKIESPLKSKLK